VVAFFVSLARRALARRAFVMFGRRCCMSMVAPVDPALTLPDPYVWTAHLVRLVGECRRGIRPWKQVYPLLDLPVVTQVWRDRRVRYPPS
jgi:hypothetical protein